MTTFPKTFYGFYWLVVKHFPIYFSVLFACGIILNVLGMIFGPLTSKWMMQIFESAISTDWHDVMDVFLCLAGMFMINSILPFITSLMRGRKQQTFNQYKLYLLYKRVYENDINFFIDYPAGRTAGFVREVSGALNQFMEKFWVELIGTVVGFCVVVGMMFKMNYWFVVILGGYGVFKTAWELLIQRQIKVNQRKTIEEDAKYAGIRSDSMNNALTVKYFAQSEYENMYIYHGRDKLNKLVRQEYFLGRCQWVPTDILWKIIQISVLAMCFFMIKWQTITIADGAYIVAAANSVNSAFNKITRLLIRYSSDYTRVKKAYDSIIIERKIVDKPHAKKLKINRASIEFDNVDFAYGKNKVLKKFNLKIKPSERVGLVGLSGAGKTTLCNLLLRMYDVDNGAIKIDGIDIRDVKQESLLKNISYVPQDTTLFNRSILENIRFARPNATKAQVIAAAKKANIHDFISKLPDGYNTLVGNNGIKLSGGQRQRISIARALLKNAPILILDEATSALDSKNEIMIQKSLQHAMRGKTTLVIAHRLATLRNVDRIIVIKDGKIIESGPHKELLKCHGPYCSLWKMQTAGFIS